MIIIGEVNHDMSGIYKITNIINNKIYIGSSIDLYRRYLSHKNQLKNGKHDNAHLQNAWDRYCGENFTFTVLELVSNKDILLEREQYWIDTLNVCDRNIGYNNSPTAGNSLGVKHSEEYRKERMLHNPGNRPILQFDTNGNFIKEWISVAALSREINDIGKTAISRRIKNKYKINNSYFIYKDEFTDELLKGVLLSKEIKRGRPKGKKVNQYDKNGNFIKMWDSITLASKTLNINKSNIGSCCSGKHFKTVGGFIWSFTD